MKKHLAILTLILGTLGILSRNACGQTPFVLGNVRWATGSPAVSVEVRLVRKDNTVKATAYTNQAGRYGFFGIEGRPSDYDIMVYSGGSLLGQKKVPPDIRPGGLVPDIILTSKLLRLSVRANPNPTNEGRPTAIVVAVRDERNLPVKDAKITIYAGGGKFLSGKKVYDSVRRKTITAEGFTNKDGSYKVEWECSPCASKYVLSVECRKDNYIMSALDLSIEIALTNR